MLKTWTIWLLPAIAVVQWHQFSCQTFQMTHVKMEKTSLLVC